MVRPPYYVAFRLLGYAERYWAAIDGEAASQGADYLALPLDRFLNAIYWWVAQRVKDSERFKYDLERPPTGVSLTEEDVHRDEQSFLAFAQAFGVTPPSPAGDTPAA